MSSYKKAAVKKDICLHISFKTIPCEKVSFYQVCPTQTLKKTAENKSLIHSAYCLVNEESLYLFCPGLQQLSVLGYSNEACHQHAEPLQQLSTSFCFHFVIWHVICMSMNFQELSLLGQQASAPRETPGYASAHVVTFQILETFQLFTFMRRDASKMFIFEFQELTALQDQFSSL